LEAFPLADAKDFGNLAVETQQYEPVKAVEPKGFVTACPSIPVPPDTNNVNQLKPGHIKAVMSMGDSITCAMSAKDTNVVNLHEYRGICYAIGADAGVVTFPNLLARYTPTGYPLGASTGIGKRNMVTNGLNAAVSGAINLDMIGQAVWLVDQLKALNQVSFNYNKDWKVLTLWIGSNNLCAVCNDEHGNDANDYRKNIMEALEFIYSKVPRVFVNLMANLDITQLYELKSGVCQPIHLTVCPCPSSLNPLTRNHVRATAKAYTAAAYEIARNFTARKNPEFAVVVQPFLSGSPIYNRTFLSPADCFHPSALAHEAISIGLWNSMLTPAAQKKTSWNPDDVPICATADSVLYTS